jgi:hypothetical protein
MKLFAAALGGFALALAACSSPPPAPATFPDLHFTDAAPVRIDAATVEIRDEFQPRFQAPYVEHEFPVPPQRAIHNLIRDRLRAVDPSSFRHIVVTVTDASAKAGQDPETSARRYDVHLAIRIELLDETGIATRRVNAEVTHSATVEEDISPDGLDAVWYTLTRNATAALGDEMVKQLDATFGPYVE